MASKESARAGVERTGLTGLVLGQTAAVERRGHLHIAEDENQFKKLWSTAPTSSRGTNFSIHYLALARNAKSAANFGAQKLKAFHGLLKWLALLWKQFRHKSEQKINLERANKVVVEKGKQPISNYNGGITQLFCFLLLQLCSSEERASIRYKGPSYIGRPWNDPMKRSKLTQEQFAQQLFGSCGEDRASVARRLLLYYFL